MSTEPTNTAERLAKLKSRLRVYVTELRRRAEGGGPHAFTYTYRYVADEIETELLGEGER